MSLVQRGRMWQDSRPGGGQRGAGATPRFEYLRSALPAWLRNDQPLYLNGDHDGGIRA
jgi:hypothetical protein